MFDENNSNIFNTFMNTSSSAYADSVNKGKVCTFKKTFI